MSMRLGTGPVFAWEWLRTSRRWQIYAARAALVVILLAGLALLWMDEVAGRTLSHRRLASIGEAFYAMIVLIQLAVVMLVAPAMTAGTICAERSRGTLSHLLMTDLSAAEIILGKLAARLLPVVSLIACSLPIAALTTLLGGVDPVLLTGAYAVTLGAAVLAATLGLVFSLWGTKVHEVLVSTYMALLGWYLMPLACLLLLDLLGSPGRVPDWMCVTNPVLLIVIPIEARRGGPYAYIDLGEQSAFLAGCLGLSALLAAVAMSRVRAVAAREGVALGNAPRPFRRRAVAWALSLPGRVWPISALIRLCCRLRPEPVLDGNPVLWRECHRRRPTRWGRALRGLYLAAALGFSLLSVSIALIQDHDEEIAGFVNGLQVAFGLLMILTTAVTCLVEERARGSLDVLLATTLTTREIVWGKWLASFRDVPLLALLAAAVSLLSARGDGRLLIGPPLVFGLVVAQGAALVSLGLWLALKVPDLGRALGWAVAGFMLVTVAWPTLTVTICDRREVVGIGLGMASPFLGPCCTTLMTSGEGPQRDMGWIYFWAFVWSFASLGFATLLLRRTLRSFDRRLGRIAAVEAEGGSATLGTVDLRFRIGDYRITISNVADDAGDGRVAAGARAIGDESWPGPLRASADRRERLPVSPMPERR